MTDSAVVLRPSEKQALALQTKAFEIMYGGARGGGKALWGQTRVLTPCGFVSMHDLVEQAYRYVIDPSTGLPIEITGYFPQGNQEIYEVQFADGGKIEATLDHLWVYRNVLHQASNAEYEEHSAEALALTGANMPPLQRWDRWRLGTTAEMISDLANGKNVWIPLSEPIAQYGDDVSDAYIASELDERVLVAPLWRRVTTLEEVFKDAGDVSDTGELAILAGDQETAQLLSQLIYSLGGKARVDGRRVRLWFPRPAFLLGGVDPGRGAVGFARRVVSITPLTNDEAFCISVRSPRGLFVAGDYVTTHNTWAGMAWLLRHIDKQHYRSMVIRRNATDLREWEDKAREMYAPFGAKFVGKPSTIRWPSGAVTYTGHLSDAHAWESVQGWEIQNLVLEEAGQIPDEERYMKLIGSLRSKFEDIPTQVLLTANPGGPGHGWLKRRFIDARDYNGVPSEPYKEFDPDGKGRRSRIYIPALIDDNPVLLESDPGYMDYLESLPPALRRAWRYGDWQAFEGAVFSEFRTMRVPGEPPEACHVVAPEPVGRYCPRWMSLDWGYSHNCAALWFARLDDGRVHVYRELVTRGVGPEELGVRLAELTLPDLEQMAEGHMVLALSPDAFARRDDRNTVAQQLASGLGMVLGADAVFLMDATEEERAEYGAKVWEAVQARHAAQLGKIRIAVKRANNDRVGGWSYMRQLLRWWPLREDKKSGTVDFSVIRDILRRPNGPELYAKYLETLVNRDEVLPKLLVHSCCPKLIEGIQRAQYDDYNKEDVKKQDGDDEIDALRYGLMAHRKDDVTLPRGVRVAKSMEEAVVAYGSLSPHSLAMMAMQREAAYKKETAQAPIRPHRGVRRMPVSV